MDYIRAIHLLRQHPELIPVVERHRGAIANAMTSSKLVGYQAFWRNANIFHEDLGRLTVYMHHVIRDAKNDQGFKFYQQIDMASEHMTKLLSDLATGKDARVHDYIKFADEWFGNMAKKGKYDNILSTAILFHKWVGHMIHLVLWTMPTKYPGRTAILLNLAHMAKNYQEQHGVFPDWAKSMIPLFRTVTHIPGIGAQTAIWGTNTGGWNPFATPGQSLNLGTPSDPVGPLQSLASANLSPLAALVFETLSGRRIDTLDPYKNQFNKPLSALDPGVLLNNLIAETPILSTLFPRGGLADNANQLSEAWGQNPPRRYNKYGAIIPQAEPPEPYNHGLILDLLARAAAASGMPFTGVNSYGAVQQLNEASVLNALEEAASSGASSTATVKAGRKK
jgi:hypothetical protein